jgi:hypothetical protein
VKMMWRALVIIALYVVVVGAPQTLLADGSPYPGCSSTTTCRPPSGVLEGQQVK